MDEKVAKSAYRQLYFVGKFNFVVSPRAKSAPQKKKARPGKRCTLISYQQFSVPQIYCRAGGGDVLNESDYFFPRPTCCLLTPVCPLAGKIYRSVWDLPEYSLAQIIKKADNFHPLSNVH